MRSPKMRSLIQLKSCAIIELDVPFYCRYERTVLVKLGKLCTWELWRMIGGFSIWSNERYWKINDSKWTGMIWAILMRLAALILLMKVSLQGRKYKLKVKIEFVTKGVMNSSLQFSAPTSWWIVPIWLNFPSTFTIHVPGGVRRRRNHWINGCSFLSYMSLKHQLLLISSFSSEFNHMMMRGEGFDNSMPWVTLFSLMNQQKSILNNNDTVRKEVTCYWSPGFMLLYGFEVFPWISAGAKWNGNDRGTELRWMADYLTQFANN